MKEDYILSYGFLDPLGKRDVEDFVARHPEYESLLAEARALYAAHQADTAAPSDAQLAGSVVDERLGVKAPTSTGAVDPLVAQRLEAFRARLDTFQPVSDPAARFEQLSGRRLQTVKQHAPADRLPSPPSFSRSRKRFVSGAVLLMVVAAVAISSFRLRAIDRLAYMPESDLRLDGYAEVLRGEQPASSEISADQLYRYALSAFKYARNPGMGLFPHYDPAELARAEALLRRIIEVEPASSFLGQEARYTLAHVFLARSEQQEARVMLQEVAAGPSRQASRAAALLQRLDR